MGWQVLGSYEVLSLILKSYALSLILVIAVVIWTASDAWIQYTEYSLP